MTPSPKPRSPRKMVTDEWPWHSCSTNGAEHILCLGGSLVLSLGDTPPGLVPCLTSGGSASTGPGASLPCALPGHSVGLMVVRQQGGATQGAATSSKTQLLKVPVRSQGWADKIHGNPPAWAFWILDLSPRELGYRICPHHPNFPSFCIRSTPLVSLILTY